MLQGMLADDEADDWDDEDDELEEEEQRPAPRRRARPARRRRAAGYETAVINRAAIGVFMTWVVRLGSALLLYFSLIGTIGAFNGNVQPLLNALPLFWAGASPTALLIGVLVQVWLTGYQTWKAPPVLTWRALLDNKAYTAHLAVDIGLSVVGYRAVVIPWVKGILTTAAQMPDGGALFAAYVVTIIAAAAIAVLPERALIKG